MHLQLWILCVDWGIGDTDGGKQRVECHYFDLLHSEVPWGGGPENKSALSAVLKPYYLRFAFWGSGGGRDGCKEIKTELSICTS